MSNKPKLRTYRKFKSHIEPEDYVIMNLNRTERSVLAKLRAGTLPLAIEKGRSKKVLLQQRLCTLCDQYDIEDEIHFVVGCSYYQLQREELFSFIVKNVDISFKELTQS